MKLSDKVWVVKYTDRSGKVRYGASYWEKKPSRTAYSRGFSDWTKPRIARVTVSTAIKHGSVVGRPRGTENLILRMKKR